MAYLKKPHQHLSEGINENYKYPQSKLVSKLKVKSETARPQCWNVNHHMATLKAVT
jgi:hypothetical protein